MRGLAFGAGLAIAASLVPGAAAGAPPTVAQCLDASEQGQALRDDGKLSRARELFGACSSPSCPAPVRASCVKWLETTIERTPSVIIVVRDESDRDVPGASVVVDGTARAKVTGQPVDVDPGSHSLVVDAPGHEGTQHSFVANVGEKNRLVRVRVARSSSSPPPSTAVVPPRAPEPPGPAARDASSGSSMPVLAIGLGAVALAGVGASLYLGLDARGELSDLRASPCGTSRSCDEGATDGIRTQLLVADVLLGVSAVTAIAAVWLWLSAPAKADGASPSVSVRAVPVRAGFAF